MNIKDIPWYDRPGFRLTREGVENLSNSELLSIIFWANDKKEDLLEISNKILRKYNLNKIEDAGYNELVDLVKRNKKAEYGDFVNVMKLLSLIEISKRYNKLVKGGFNKKPIHSAKDVFKEAIKESAYSIILVHNHPSGEANPSKDDIRVTDILTKAGEILNIKVLDHIIIGKKDYWSLRE